MTLQELIKETNSPNCLICDGQGNLNLVQVFPATRERPRFFDLDDYRVLSAVSGPSFIMGPRNRT